MKSSLRSYIRSKKKEYSATQLAEMSDAVCSSILEDGVWRVVNTILLYYPLTDEVDVRALIRRADMQGKLVLLPKVVGEELELRVYQGESSLAKGAFNIMEPVGELFPEERYGEIDMAVIPGMAFTPRGARLGRGKGFYDRLLPKLSNAWKVGACFPFQVMDEIPTEAHDIKLDEVVWR